MAKSRSDQPSVTSFGDHQVITPVHKLGKAVVAGGKPDPDFDPVARAEAALADLSSEFDGWMRSECERLDRARQRVKEAGLADHARDELFRAAHDIKGEAATFGYPLAAEAADSLCRLIEHVPDAARIPLALVDQHVDGVRAIIREDARQDGNRIANALVATLRRVADEFLLRENRDRPGYLEGIVAPPIVPKG